MMVLCRSSDSPLRKLSTLFEAVLLNSLTLLIASSRMAPKPAAFFEPESSCGASMALGEAMCGMEKVIRLSQQIDGFLDHILHGRHGRDVGLITTGGGHQIHHVLGRVHAGKSNIAGRVRIGV